MLTRLGAPGLEEHNRFIIDPVQIMYSAPKMKEFSTDQVAKMQQYLQDKDSELWISLKKNDFQTLGVSQKCF